MTIMFNEEVKSQYIDSLATEAMKRDNRSLFRRTSETEALLNKDIFSFTLNECMLLLADLNPRSIGLARTFRSRLSQYTSWAEDSGLKASGNPWVLVYPDTDFSKLAHRMSHVKDISTLEEIVELSLAGAYDKYVVYMLHMGIMGNNFTELVEVEEGNVSVINRTIKTSKQIYEMSDPLFSLLQKGGYEQEIRPARDEKSKYFIKPFVNKNYKGTETIRPGFVYRIFNKLITGYFEATGEIVKYTPQSIHKSGMYYSIYQFEKSNGGIVGDDIVNIYVEYGGEVDPQRLPTSRIWDEYNLYREAFWSD